MTLRRSKPVIFPPAGISDALDGAEDFPGACSLLTNLIPAQNNKGMMVARVAAQQLASLPDYGGGPLTCLLTVGDMAYGMYASAQFPGKDTPFAYNMATGTFLTIGGITSGNLPASQSTTGDWTPPTADQIATRVLFTHPGFPGGTSLPTQFTGSPGNLTNGSPIVTGFPFGIIGIAPGATLTGNGIPPGTTVASWTASNITVNATGVATQNTISVASATGLFVGQVISLPTTPNATGDVIASIAGTTITLLYGNLASNFTSQPTTFQTATLTMSQNATATANDVAIYETSSVAPKFGWLDLSGFSTTINGNTSNGTPAIFGGFNIAGIQPGMPITGPGIPAGTTVLAASNVAFNVLATLVAGSITIADINILPVTSGINNVLAPNQNIAGPGLATGTTLLSLTEPFGIPFGNAGGGILSQPAVLSETEATYGVSGGIIILSQPATATTTGAVSFTVTGGTPAAPLWAAGDTQGIPLAGVPVFVKQYGGSACFGVNTTNPQTAGVTFSDPGIPCQQTNASQTITFRNAIPVTAAQGLPLDNQLGGIIQSLTVFQGASNLQQITGVPALNNISVNTSQVATGTLAPNSIASTPKGIIFAAPDGLRLLDFDGRVSDPIGVRGQGIVIPFINAVTPTRMAANFSKNIYRITLTWQPPPVVQPIYGTAQRTDEFWLHLDTGKFTGPHTSTMDLIAPWISRDTFICSPTFGRGALWRSDPDPNPGSSYVENSVALNWLLRTVLLPDDPTMTANSLVESSLFASMSAATQWLASAIDDQGATMAQAYAWLGPNVTQSQLPLYWNNPAVFRQMVLKIAGNSEPQTVVGTIMLRYQKLNYPLPFRPVQEFVLGQSIPGGGDVLGP